jgi:hypothetical protein
MNQRELRRSLERFRTELEKTESIDENARELLRDLEREIEEVLERSGEEGSPADHSVAEHLSAAIAQFEAEHPTLTASLTEILDSLARMGF